MGDTNYYARIAGYSLIYKSLKLKLAIDYPYVYELGIITVLSSELDKGFKAKSIGKPSASGTKINYEPVLKKETLRKYYDEVLKRLMDLKRNAEAMEQIRNFFQQDYEKILTNRWTGEELDYLKENYGKVGAGPIAEKLNRNKNAVWKKASRLKIPGPNRDL